MNRRHVLGGLAGALGAMATLSAAGRTIEAGFPKPSSRYRRIATEEAFATPPQLDGFRDIGKFLAQGADLSFTQILLGDSDYARDMTPRLLDIGAGRVAQMDADGVDMQVLSLTSPGVQLFSPDTAVAIARESNDILADAIRKHPGRFAGLAAIAPHDARRSVTEMDRAINRLGLNGFIVNSHTNGEYLDEEKFWPILEAAEALDRPIYIHPRSLPETSLAPFRPYGLAGASWGYAVETGTHGMRLLFSGVFDRFPNLKIILGHMGEGIPYWVYRFDHMYATAKRNWGTGSLKEAPSFYLKRNMLITTSGMFSEPVLRYCLEVLGADNILWAADYPYQDNREAAAFLDAARIPEADKVKIYSGNAERVFHIKT
ncbi:MAG: amidohydrolase [Proteobacteria bacterium]|nr:MAG: amidohydrolase [Pseudomonadota bacterium]